MNNPIPASPTIIKPTIGRRVLYHPSIQDVCLHDSGLTRLGEREPFDAGVIYVHGDRCVNLLVTDHVGVVVPRLKVRLLQEGDLQPEGDEPYATWMPYQIGQAKATEAIPALAASVQDVTRQSTQNSVHADAAMSGLRWKQSGVAHRQNDAATIEQEIQAKGKTAARVTPADLQANIESFWFFTAAEGCEGAAEAGTPREQQPPVGATSPLRLLTICVLVLKNGFTVTGESACASPENFDAEIGRKIARQNAEQKILPLMGYALRERLASEKDVPVPG